MATRSSYARTRSQTTREPRSTKTSSIKHRNTKKKANVKSQDYEVEAIVDMSPGTQKGKGRRKFLVSWVGFDEQTWEPESNLPSSLVSAFCSARADIAHVSGTDAANTSANVEIETDANTNASTDINADADADADADIDVANYEQSTASNDAEVDVDAVLDVEADGDAYEDDDVNKDVNGRSSASKDTNADDSGVANADSDVIADANSVPGVNADVNLDADTDTVGKVEIDAVADVQRGDGINADAECDGANINASAGVSTGGGAPDEDNADDEFDFDFGGDEYEVERILDVTTEKKNGVTIKKYCENQLFLPNFLQIWQIKAYSNRYSPDLLNKYKR
jgi:hypothetical protein